MRHLPPIALVVEMLQDVVLEIVIGVMSLVFVGGLAWYQARKAWRRREYLSRLNVSLNFIEGGTLKIRTLLEQSLDEVFLNSVAVRAVRAAARQTTVNDPILHFRGEDQWFILNAVLNAISERFATGILKRDIYSAHSAADAAAIRSADYLFCLTCEKDKQVRTQKIRAMLIRADLLTSLGPDEPQFDRPTHSTRWKTLKVMAECYAANPDELLRLELCV